MTKQKVSDTCILSLLISFLSAHQPVIIYLWSFRTHNVFSVGFWRNYSYSPPVYDLSLVKDFDQIVCQNLHPHPTPHSLGLNIIRCIILSLWIVISTTIKLLSWTYLFGDSMYESGVKIPSNSNYYDFKNQYIQKRTQAKPDCEIICNVWCFCNKSGTRVFWWLSNTLESENTGGLFSKVNATPKGLLLGPQMFKVLENFLNICSGLFILFYFTFFRRLFGCFVVL